MENMANLDAVKLQYCKVTARTANLGWTSGRGTNDELINFKNEYETVDGIATVIWDISNLPDYEYEVRLKSECMNNNEQVPKKLRQFYSEPIVGLIDKTPPRVFGLPQPAVNLSP